ncbi:hypothetical protein [Gimesia sp.]|uniref:hypothetical protein n=1 Tax=Gimesia sp. TaxID=2024833 RepID=UPI003A958A05
MMLTICLIAVLITSLLPDIQQAKDYSLQGPHKEGPYWIYREYEYAGGPVVHEISGSYQHSLQEILDMYADSLRKQQEQYLQELSAEKKKSVAKPATRDTIPGNESEITESVFNKNEVDDFVYENSSREEIIEIKKRAIKNFKLELSRNAASLVARRNLVAAIQRLEQDLKRLESMP